ncbi:hypothetical protein JCM1840_002515 [Sporobolomyces johnsonii]
MSSSAPAGHAAALTSSDESTEQPPPQETTFPPPAPPLRQTQTEGERVPPAMVVRVALLRRLWLATVELQGARRNRLICITVFGFAQLVAWIVVLASSYGEPCDRPLGLYLILVCVRIAVAFPLFFWTAISQRPGPRDSADQRAAMEANRRIGNAYIDRQVRRVGDLVSLLSLVLFVCGNVWVITSNTCSMTAPTLYKGALAALILSWFWTAEFLIYILLVIFFLPFFLIGMRFFGLGQAKNEVGPLKKADIEKLPQRIFVGTLPTSSEESSSSVPPDAPSTLPKAATSSPTTPSVHSPQYPQFWRLWRRMKAPSAPTPGGSNSNDCLVPFPPGVEPLQLPASQSACSICLCEYELPPNAGDASASSWEPELLRLLPCGHAFHSPCLADWLAVSGRCPLCQRPVDNPGSKKSRKGPGRQQEESTSSGRSGGGRTGSNSATAAEQV